MEKASICWVNSKRQTALVSELNPLTSYLTTAGAVLANRRSLDRQVREICERLATTTS